MAEISTSATEQDCLQVSGELVFATAPGLLGEAASLFRGQRELIIDLGQVSRCDSAGLALLLEWLERGRSQGISIRFRNIPESLLRIARLSNVASLLPEAIRDS